MADLTEDEYRAAVRRGTEEAAHAPRARAARFTSRGRRLVVDLVSGATFSVPVRLLQGMEGATAHQLADVEVTPAGAGLHWEELDIDFTVAGLLAGRFGTAQYMVERFGSAEAAE